jgi:tripartite ATP-independent transporter DctM subunit
MSSENMAIIILMVSFLGQVAVGINIIFAMGLSALVTTIFLGLPLVSVAQNMVSGLDTFTLLSVPFFIIMGEIMGAGGIADKLVKLANALVGWMRAGLAMVNVADSMFFGGISGSASADVASIGAIMIPIMKKQGYDEDFSAGITLASSIQGILIPPSINMIVYSLAAGGVSIGRLFLAGMAPGIFLGIALMIYSYFVSVKRNYPKGDPFSIKVLARAFKECFLALLTILIVMLGVLGGIFTATESAAIAAVYAFIITFFVYKEIPLKEIWPILSRAARTMSTVLVLIGCATAFGWLIAYLRIPLHLSSALLSFSKNPIIILMIINLMLLVLGTIANVMSIIIIMTPILLPVVTAIGISPVHFGIIMILNLGIGLITPPVGSVLYVGCAVAHMSIEKLSKALIPFYIVMFITLLFITYIPGITMFLPDWLMPV